MTHDPMCPIDPDQRMPKAVSCLWCEVIAKVRVDERERLALKWSEEGHGVRFNHAHDDMNPNQRVLKWIRGIR